MPTEPIAFCSSNEYYDDRQSSERKVRQYRTTVGLVTGLVSNISSLKDDATNASKKQFVEDFEDAASYSALDPGFVRYKVFHTLIKKAFGSGLARQRYEELLRRPHLRQLWKNAEAQEAAYMRDLTTDSVGHTSLSCGNYATHFWPAFKAEFLNIESVPWHVAHYARFSRKGQEQGKLTVIEYYEQ